MKLDDVIYRANYNAWTAEMLKAVKMRMNDFLDSVEVEANVSTSMSVDYFFRDKRGLGITYLIVEVDFFQNRGIIATFPHADVERLLWPINYDLGAIQRALISTIEENLEMFM